MAGLETYIQIGALWLCSNNNNLCMLCKIEPEAMCHIANIVHSLRMI